MGEVERQQQGFMSEYGAISTEVALRLPHNLEWNDYCAIVALLGSITRSSAWWVGDTILHGETVYGDQYAQAVDMFGMAYQTLMNYASVCRSVAPDRRRPDLSFGHHQAVAKLDAAGQVYWLEQAAEHEWSRAQLREALAKATQPGHGTQAGTDEDAQPGAAAAQPQQQPQGTVTVLPPAAPTEFPASLSSVAEAARTLYDTALPLAQLAHDTPPYGYWAVPVDVMGQLASALGEELPGPPVDDVPDADLMALRDSVQGRGRQVAAEPAQPAQVQPQPATQPNGATAAVPPPQPDYELGEEFALE